VTPLNSVQQSDAAVPTFVTLTGSEQYAPAHVLYAVGHRSPHDASSSPGPGDTSPRAPSQLSPAAGSPHWFTHSPSPPSPSRLGDVVAPGELSPAHASALQQQFQQFSMASSSNSTLFFSAHLYREGHRGSPVGIPREWKPMLWGSCRNGNKCHGTLRGMVEFVRDSRRISSLFDFGGAPPAKSASVIPRLSNATTPGACFNFHGSAELFYYSSTPRTSAVNLIRLNANFC